jgi:hypothetical protein
MKPVLLIALLTLAAPMLAQSGYNPQYPMKRPPRATPAPAISAS